MGFATLAHFVWGKFEFFVFPDFHFSTKANNTLHFQKLFLKNICALEWLCILTKWLHLYILYIN